MLSETMLGGVRIVASPHMPPPGEDGFPDWRARLARWLTPTSRIPKREPLTKPRPDVFLIGGTLFANPLTLAVLVNVSRLSPEARDGE